MFELEEKSLPCIETSPEDNDLKPEKNGTISENDAVTISENNEDTISENDFMDLRRRCVEKEVMLIL